MADKDILEKVLMSYADVFADCENVLLYGGRERVRAADLQPAPTESFYSAAQQRLGCIGGLGKRMHNQFCDVSFYRMENGEIKGQYIIENETRLKKRLVLRKASYQGGAYRQQLGPEKAVYPVISMVIDWGRKKTRIPLSLHALLAQGGVPEEELGLVDDVRLSVCHMKQLPKETREKFTSDIGFVADYLNEGSFENRKNQRIVHVEALCEMMEALTGDARFTSLIGQLLSRQREGEEIVMCDYIDMLEARGQARGEAIGEARGQAKGEAIGQAKGEAIGQIKGETMLASLLAKLYSLGRDEDAKLAVRDEIFRKRLYQEFCIVS